MNISLAQKHPGRTPSPYWTGSKHGICYVAPDGTSIDYPDEDGRPLLIDSLKKTLGLSQAEAEHFADNPGGYA